MHEISLNRYNSAHRTHPSDLPSLLPLNAVIPSSLPINPVTASDCDRNDWYRLTRRQKPPAATARSSRLINLSEIRYNPLLDCQSTFHLYTK